MPFRSVALNHLQTEAVRWEAESYRTTAAFLPTIVGWLSEPDDGLAAHAAALLPWLPANPAVVSALIDAPTHQVQACASANLALAHSPHVDPRIEQHLQRLLSAPSAPVAVTAAVALAYLNGNVLPRARPIDPDRRYRPGPTHRRDRLGPQHTRIRDARRTTCRTQLTHLMPRQTLTTAP
jgi:hypothetical protein